MKTGTLLILVICFQVGFACHHEFTKNNTDYDDDYAYYYSDEDFYHSSKKESIINCTIVCSNIYSISEIFYEYQEHDYDQFLKITDSNITTLHPNGLSKFSTIVKLYLSEIHLKEILPGAFSGLLKLKELRLDGNELTDISKGIFTSLEELRILNLNYNRIHRIENFALKGVSALRNLHLQRNNLSFIDDDAFIELKVLNFLDLSGNPIKKLKIESLSDLEYLYLNTTLVKDFGDLPNSNVQHLKVLNMTSSQITSVDFSKFPKVLHLTLSNNNITLLKNSQNLSAGTLDLQNNQIKHIKTGFYNLQKLILSHNELETLNQTLLNNSQSIHKLHLGFNKISIIEPNTFKNLTFLEELCLENNNLSHLEIDLFVDLTNLRLLNLSSNKIEKFKFGIFENLRSLEYLDVSHNNVLQLHPLDLYSSRNLFDLNFSYNKISSFDVTNLRRHLPSLKSISIEGNFWKCKQLAQIAHELKNSETSLKEGNSYDVENINGIACQNDDFKEKSNDSSKTELIEFQKLKNDNHTYSDLQRIVNDDFKNSEFVRFFKDFNESSFSKKKNVDVSWVTAEKKTSSFRTENTSNGILIFGLILQLLTCLVLIFIVYLAVCFLKKRIAKNRNPRVSKVEICSGDI